MPACKRGSQHIGVRNQTENCFVCKTTQQQTAICCKRLETKLGITWEDRITDLYEWIGQILECMKHGKPVSVI